MKAVLFDLDGTLLSCDMKEFEHRYIRAVSQVLPGRDPRQTAKDIMDATYRMIDHDDGRSNEAAFWAAFEEGTGISLQEVGARFEAFYQTEFPKLGAFFPAVSGARAAVEACRTKGYRAILATNPVFPAMATRERLRWAGFTPEEFELITAYEDSCSCKPHERYYREVLRRAGSLEPADCLMVGNDELDDMAPAARLGMKTFLVTDHVLNEGCSACDGRGSWPELLAFIEAL